MLLQIHAVNAEEEDVDASDIDIVLCPTCYCECSSTFLPFHRQHKHSGKSLSNDRKVKQSI